MKRYKNDFKYFLDNKIFLLSIVLVSIISYGYAATNISVSIDDLEADRYVGSGNSMLSNGRFSMVLLSKLFGYGTNIVQNSFAIDVLAVVFLILSAVNFCILFKRNSHNKINTVSYIVFACAFVSYPLMHEIWEYTAANLCVCCGYFSVSLTLIIINDIIMHKEKIKTGKKIFGYVLSFALMTFVCSSYESVVLVYIFMVFAIFSIQIYYNEEKTAMSQIIKNGMIYCFALIGAIVLRVVIQRILILILNLNVIKYGDTIILWGTEPIKNTIISMIARTGFHYFIQGLLYFPITEFVICFMLFVILGICICIKTKKTNLFFTGMGMLISPFLLTLLQGFDTPYRACQVFSVFVAFTFMIVFNGICNNKSSVIRLTAVLLSAIICLQQAFTVNYYLTLNNQRYLEEKNIIQNIIVDLDKNNYDKDIIFVGSHQLGDNIYDKICAPTDTLRWKVYSKIFTYACSFTNEDIDIYGRRERQLPSSNVNSLIDWGTRANDQISMKYIFDYFGYDYTPADYNKYIDSANAYVEKNNTPTYPDDGYIVDTGEYVIVNIK